MKIALSSMRVLKFAGVLVLLNVLGSTNCLPAALTGESSQASVADRNFADTLQKLGEPYHFSKCSVSLGQGMFVCKAIVKDRLMEMHCSASSNVVCLVESKIGQWTDAYVQPPGPKIEENVDELDCNVGVDCAPGAVARLSQDRANGVKNATDYFQRLVGSDELAGSISCNEPYAVNGKVVMFCATKLSGETVYGVCSAKKSNSTCVSLIAGADIEVSKIEDELNSIFIARHK